MSPNSCPPFRLFQIIISIMTSGVGLAWNPSPLLNCRKIEVFSSLPRLSHSFLVGIALHPLKQQHFRKNVSPVRNESRFPTMVTITSILLPARGIREFFKSKPSFECDPWIDLAVVADFHDGSGIWKSCGFYWLPHSARKFECNSTYYSPSFADPHPEFLFFIAEEY